MASQWPGMIWLLARLPMTSVLVDGQIVRSGGPELAQQIEHEGYDTFRPVAL